MEHLWQSLFVLNIQKHGQEFRLPDTLEPINILAIGYANDNPADPERHQLQRISLNELDHYKKL